MRPYWIYLIYTSVLALVLITFVPRDKIKENAVHSILLGGVADILAIIIVTHLLKAGGYKNFMPFGFSGFPFFPPIAWTIWFVIYFYLLPEEKWLKYLYLLTAAAYSIIFSNVLVNLGIMYWNYGRTLVPFIIYITWLTSVTWLKERLDRKL